jgi:hypothetical protein
LRTWALFWEWCCGFWTSRRLTSLLPLLGPSLRCFSVLSFNVNVFFFFFGTFHYRFGSSAIPVRNVIACSVGMLQYRFGTSAIPVRNVIARSVGHILVSFCYFCNSSSECYCPFGWHASVSVWYFCSSDQFGLLLPVRLACFSIGLALR